ncbi:hypothetical protein GW933_00320 [Candidatus Falkowbacteria bacterium]|uniref:Uncharacterized protein n=1 Tax=Candidatus Buchananbacteria bacterium CG10_big_fil_rev_8_21_14_0_10_33_19 TaxID=1974525 RepID=A0A2H0W2X0_9BACT|nr:hypothetical protein [Candidatus Falkowbacteria bacterium]PIS05703.1 MAG: hypothetical protein COT80_02945 [Candidatus Buchananbacteria bacterium CG10_big_fil_rev_8_21_14_0_10_33_19]
MFGSKKNNITPLKDVMPASSEDVYVMPEKFHSQRSGGSSDKTLMIVIIILVLIMTAIGSYFIYNSWQKNQNQTNQNINQNIAIVNQNVNDNQNINGSRNFNSNENINVNGNENVNSNLNANSDGSDNQNSTSTAPVINELVPPAISGDADKDGLTDLEESLIGTSASSPDSDLDGYLDSDELIGGYNPIINPNSGSLIKLIDASFVSKLMTDFPTNNFKTLYIKGWSVSMIEALHEARIITGTGEMIKISVINNADQVSAANWYLLGHPQITLSQLGNLEFGNFKGIRAPNGLAVYLTDQKREKIYVIEYDLDTSTEFRYPSIFEMVIRNFDLIGESIKVIDDTTNNNSASTSPVL